MFTTTFNSLPVNSEFCHLLLISECRNATMLEITCCGSNIVFNLIRAMLEHYEQNSLPSFGNSVAGSSLFAKERI